MKIYIPSRGRPDYQPTAVALSEADIPFLIVKSDSDESNYSAYPHISVPSKHIGEKRQMILDQGDDKLLMLDDDLGFRKRTEDNKFIKAGKREVLELITLIEAKLDDYGHVGVMDEFMSQAAPRGFRENGRYNQVLGYNTKLWQGKPSFRLMINEEHDMNLQLQAQGLKPCIICEYTKSSKFYAKGGLSHVRTPEVEREQHQKFADYWPNLVTIKPSSKSLSGVRVTVKWRKANHEDHNPNIPSNEESVHVSAAS